MVMKEKEVMIKGNVSIGATVSCPDDGRKYPAVVLIMGTGKTDRDGNEKGFKTDLYKNFAKMFAECGFVSVRYDKRGTYQTKGVLRQRNLQRKRDCLVCSLEARHHRKRRMPKLTLCSRNVFLQKRTEYSSAVLCSMPNG